MLLILCLPLITYQYIYILLIDIEKLPNSVLAFKSIYLVYTNDRIVRELDDPSGCSRWVARTVSMKNVGFIPKQ